MSYFLFFIKEYKQQKEILFRQLVDDQSKSFDIVKCGTYTNSKNKSFTSTVLTDLYKLILVIKFNPPSYI